MQSIYHLIDQKHILSLILAFSVIYREWVNLAIVSAYHFSSFNLPAIVFSSSSSLYLVSCISTLLTPPLPSSLLLLPARQEQSFASLSPEEPSTIIQFTYTTNAQMFSVLKRTAAKCSQVAQVYSLGRSSEGRDLLAIEFSRNPGQHELSESGPSSRGNSW